MREQGINWKKTGGQNQYIDDDFEKWVAFAAKVLFDVVCALIFISSARVMLSDVYYWGEFSGVNLSNIAVIAVVISVVMEFADISKKKLKFVLQWGVLLVGTAMVTHYIMYGEDTQSLLSGIQKMVGFYVEDWNTYYETSVVYVTGKLIYVTESLDFVTMILFFVLFWMAKMLKQNLVMAVAPVLVLSLEFLVGHSPEYEGLMQLFIAVLLSNTSKWAAPDFSIAPGRKYVSIGSIRFFSWVVIAVAIYILCGIVKTAGTAKAEEMIIYSADIREMYNDVVDEISEFSIWDVFDGEKDSNITEVNNDTPNYKGTEILELSIWSKPRGNLYLKGYYAEYYKNGVWENDYKLFEDACKEAGFDPDEITRKIASMGIDRVLQDSGIVSLEQSGFGYSAIITYLEDSGKKAYVPYFSQLYEDKEDDITFEGDGRYRKDRDLSEMSLTIWAYSGVYESNLLLIPDGENEAWQSWYEEYVLKTYLEVPDNMENVKLIAKQLRAWNDYSYDGSIWENERRLKFGRLVAEWMQENTVYTLNPPDLPKDIEPIEYFLGDSKRGYCMHYASASVMILRELGVPARYASGYIVKNDSYENKHGNYVATVKDRDAHAWVEIYLNDIGWVPFEVTKGYNASVIEEPQTSKPTENTTSRPNVSEPTTEKDTTKKPDEELETSTLSEAQTTSDFEGNGDEEPSGSGTDAGNSGKEKSFDAKKIIKTIAGIIALSLVVLGMDIYKDWYRKRLEKEIKNNKTLNAIKMINHRIYKNLRRRGKILRFNIRDDEYKKVLIANYPQIDQEDWDKYMDIVKAAAFSKRAFSAEEMHFCHGVYRKVMEE